MEESFAIIDNGGRRSGFDRRTFLYAACLPERRTHQERRCQADRRQGFEVNLSDDPMEDRRQKTIETLMVRTG
jgi:hypothetical protein